jgi:hypothetical protein
LNLIQEYFISVRLEQVILARCVQPELTFI